MIQFLFLTFRFMSKFRLKATEIYCPDPTFPRFDSLYPPSSTILPPYIIHIESEKIYNNIQELIEKETDLPMKYIHELIDFGSIYIQTKTNKTERYIPRMESSSLKQKKIPVGFYCRVHVNPRRYPDVYKYSTDYWLNCMIPNNEQTTNNYIVIDKPIGSIPTSSTVDNHKENLIEIYKNILHLKELYATGRLDACTSGCIIFAKSNKAASILNSFLRDRSVKKTYLALCHEYIPGTTAILTSASSTSSGESSSPPPLGLIQHGFRRLNKLHPSGKPSLLCKYNPELISDVGNKNGQEWQLAELIIHRTTPILLLNKDGENIKLWEIEIELLTGRTHQIRLQLSALGYPLYGDTRYIPVANMLDDSTSTITTTTTSNLKGEPGDRGDGKDLFGPEPKTEIGLHCARLEFPSHAVIDNIPIGAFESAKPWWRI